MDQQTLWNIHDFPFFHTHLPDPPSCPLSFSPRWSPHWGGGHPGAGHREPHHLRRDCPALGCLCLCSQQAWHAGQKNSTGPAGGARCVPPYPQERRGKGFPTASSFCPCSLHYQHPCPRPRTLDSPGFLYLPLPGSPGPQARSHGQLSSLPHECTCWEWEDVLGLDPVYPFQVPARLL